MHTIEIDGDSLSLEAFERVVRTGVPIRLASNAEERIDRSRAQIEDILDGDAAVYGVTTGFGDLVSERISRERIDELQVNLVRSHAAGLGEPLPEEVVRAMMLARANALAKGFSGVRQAVIDQLLALVNAGVHPVIPRIGSLGTSGDLAPLAHMALVMIGEGEAVVEGTRLPGASALDRAGVEPLELGAKEGLALINGTQLSTGIAALLVRDAERVVDASTVAGAMTTEVTFSTTATSDPRISDVRPHAGQARVARRIRRLTSGSDIIAAHADCDRVQDPYSIRCLPQVHGAVSDAIAHLRGVVEIELNSATDNPLVFDPARVSESMRDTGVLSCGNFHGAPLAYPLDYVADAMTDLGAITERRIDRLQNPNVQEDHLPPFLTSESGVRSGLMITQYVAAALVNTNRSTHSASTDNATVSGNQEDHASMSATSAIRARAVLSRARLGIAIELLCATEALEYLSPLEPGVGTAAARDVIREHVPPLAGDRPLSADIETIDRLIDSGELADRIEKCCTLD